MKLCGEILSKVILGKDLTHRSNSIIALFLVDITLLRGFSCNVMGSDPSLEAEIKPQRVYSIENNLHK